MMGTVVRTIAPRGDADRPATRSASAVGITRQLPVDGPLWMIPVAMACGKRSCSSTRRRCRSRPNGSREPLAGWDCGGGVQMSTATGSASTALVEHPLVADLVRRLGRRWTARLRDGPRGTAPRVQAAAGTQEPPECVSPDADLTHGGEASRRRPSELRRGAVHGGSIGPAGAGCRQAGQRDGE